MKAVPKRLLAQVIAASSEPVMIVRLDHTDWPVVLANPAVEALGVADPLSMPFAEVIETLIGRNTAIEVSETLRAREENGFPIEASGREYLLALKPLILPGEDEPRFYAVFWRGASGSGAVRRPDAERALLKARRRIRDLSRDDPATGLLNARAFREIFEHDWAVAARSESRLALVLFTLDDFDAYVEVFGQHASDSCLRRVGQAIRRFLRRASDVVARLDGGQLVVLSHVSEEAGVRLFAERIAVAVRDLGLHHPRSSLGRFVTVSYRIAALTAGNRNETAEALLDELIDAEPGQR